MSKRSPQKKQPPLDPQVENALKQLGIAQIDWKRHISAADVLYLLDHCPFLRITNTAALPPGETVSLQLVEAKSGWHIHHEGNAMSSSPGEFLFFGGDFRIRTPEDKDQGGEGSGTVNPGKGTVVNQAVMTAFDMVTLAHKLGWEGVRVIDGHPLMVWAAWMQALDLGVALEGYAPTAQDIVKRSRVKKAFPERPSAAPRL